MSIVLRFETQRLHSIAHRRHSATITLVLLLVLTSAISRPTPAANAATVAALPPPHALAVPARFFPPGADPHGTSVSNSAATHNTGLHTLGLAALGRMEGYEGQALWHIAEAGGRFSTVTVLYESSVFATAHGADVAQTDARVSLWERGQPLAPSESSLPAFTVRSHAGTTWIIVVSSWNRIESEFVLSYSTSSTGAAARTALRQFTYLWKSASTRNLQLSAGLASLPPSITASPDLYLAPAGTGPVVASPSLMVLSAAAGMTGTLALHGGLFRSDVPTPLGARSTPVGVLVPRGSLSRYVQLAGTSTGDSIYDSASLFADSATAQQAYDTLRRANDALHLRPVPFRAVAAGLQRLAAVDAVQIWQRGSEIIIALRLHNILMVLAERGPNYASLPSTTDTLLATVPSWLHAQGTQIVDETNAPVHLSGLNWYGAEQQDFVVGGLDYATYASILWMIKNAGYNTIRLPFSNQLVEQNPVITAHVRDNPELIGLHALDILDRIIAYAGALGMRVILDDHRSEAGWSSQESGLWYSPTYPETTFVNDWAAVAARYAGTNTVIGADLRNEPHGVARWGNGDPATDWKAAAERAGTAVLAADPHLLVVVEGVQYYGTAPSYWWGGNLMGVATAPVALRFADGSSAHSQLVYSAHDYGVDNCATGCPWFNTSTTYDSLTAVWERYWGYITDDASRAYAAPVWVGEFGTCNYNAACVTSTMPGSQGQWFQSLIQYISSKHLNWAYWSANGTQSTGGTRTYGDLDWYGYFSRDWTTDIPWLSAALHIIQDDGRSSVPSGHTT